ncbi:MAG: oligosaccharide flippase family protein [Verrucomicrobiaceae bacterium]|nr:oligosaccharide flippase family protein [Verrucomicrobiaceae bacterium]
MKTVKDTLWFLFSAAFGPGLFFLLLPFWTRILDKEEFALIGILRTIEGIGIAFLVLGFAGAVTRYYHEAKSPRDFASFFTSSLVIGGVIGVFIVTACCGIILGIPDLLAPLPAGFVVIAVIAIYLMSLPESMVFGSWMTAERAAACACFKISNAVVSTFLQLGFVLASTDRLQGWVTGYFFGAVYICASSIFFARREGWLNGAIRRHHAWYALAFGLPLVPHVLSNWILRAADRFILLKLVSVESLAQYTLAASLSIGLAIIVNAFGQAWTPRFFRFAGEGGQESKIRAYYYSLIYLTGMLTIVSCFVLNYAGGFTFGHSYAPSWRFFVPLAGATLFLAIYQYFVGFLFYEKRTRLIPIITGVAALVNIGLNLYFIPTYGVVSAGYTTLASYGVMAVGAYVISARVGRLKLNVLPTFVWVTIVIVASHLVVGPVNRWQAATFSLAVIILLGVLGVFVLSIRTHGAVIRSAVLKHKVS